MMVNRIVVKTDKNKAMQIGSASVESIMILGILLPIGMGIVLIGKVYDLHQTATQASRFATWQSTAQTHADLANPPSEKIRSLFFADPAQPISSLNKASDTPVNPLWGSRDETSETSLFSITRLALESDQAVKANYQSDIDAAGIASGLSDQVGNLTSIFGAVSNGEWTIHGNGLVKASVEVGVQSHEWLKGSQSCANKETGTCIRSQGVILSDGWSAASDSEARQRVQTFMPSSVLQPVGDTVANIGGSLLFPELKGLKDAFGHVDMNALPESARPDRASDGRRIARYGRTSAKAER